MSKIAKIVNGRIIYGEHSEVAKPNDTAARENRQRMKTDGRKDLLQPNQTDFYRAYPEQLEDLPDETKRLLS